MSKKKSDRSTSTVDERQAAKKAAVLGTDKKSRLPLLVTILACALIVVLAGVFFFRGSGKETPSVVASGETVTYPVATFEDGKARHYQMKTGSGTRINFFILKSSDSIIRAAFDACDVCWKAGLGCGQQFASVKVNEVRGGCNPAPLDREVVGDQVVIKVKDIVDGKRYFDISGRS
jgi:uncharacterized membrane protein